MSFSNDGSISVDPFCFAVLITHPHTTQLNFLFVVFYRCLIVVCLVFVWSCYLYLFVWYLFVAIWCTSRALFSKLYGQRNLTNQLFVLVVLHCSWRFAQAFAHAPLHYESGWQHCHNIDITVVSGVTRRRPHPSDVCLSAQSGL